MSNLTQILQSKHHVSSIMCLHNPQKLPSLNFWSPMGWHLILHVPSGNQTRFAGYLERWFSYEKTSIQLGDFPASHVWWNQRVNPIKSHQTIIFLWFSYGFPMVFHQFPLFSNPLFTTYFGPHRATPQYQGAMTKVEAKFAQAWHVGHRPGIWKSTWNDEDLKMMSNIHNSST